MKHLSTLLILSLALLAGCSNLVGETPDGSSPEVPVPPTGGPSGEDCVRPPIDNLDIDTGSLAGDALFLAAEVFQCADDIVIVGPDDLNEIVVASQLAAALQAPLLYPEPRLAAEIGRLKARQVHIVGDIEVDVPGGTDVTRHDLGEAVEAAKNALGVVSETEIPGPLSSRTVIEAFNAIQDQERVVRPLPLADEQPATPGSIPAGELVDALARPSEGVQLWVVDAADPATLLSAAVAGKAANAAILPIGGEDLLGNSDVAAAVAGYSPGDIRFIGGQPPSTQWEISLLMGGQQVPGGGFLILPEDRQRRYVAFYGHPGTTALGALGEQGPAETIEVMQEFLNAYAGDGSQVIPTFEIIATVASHRAGSDGNYSNEWPIELFSEWIDFARDNGVYVILDLQPGRSDFLSQAKLYEELLKLPFVGLALDPEWRLGPDQVHLEQVGTVDAAEINETINWVADLVRDNGLPQKMIIAHQFRTSMITNRETLIERPEIQLVIQMDGDGAEEMKDNTYRILQQGAEDAHWRWGWKNFFDEDEPGPPTPESTMSKTPPPVYVSYQ